MMKIPENKQLQPVAALEQAIQLGGQASEIVQLPPHPLPVWESAQQKWTQAVQRLESIPSDAEVYEAAQVRLTSYRANQTAIVQRIETEKEAADSYETGNRLIDQFVALSQPIAYPTAEDLPTLEQISVKLEMAIKAFQAIPSGTLMSERAQEKIDAYSKNYQDLQSIIKTLEDCKSERTYDCSVNEYVWPSTSLSLRT